MDLENVLSGSCLSVPGGLGAGKGGGEGQPPDFIDRNFPYAHSIELSLRRLTCRRA